MIEGLDVRPGKGNNLVIISPGRSQMIITAHDLEGMGCCLNLPVCGELRYQWDCNL